MKKSLVFRLFVLAVFCMVSLVIKSETGSCKATRYCTWDKPASRQSILLDDDTKNVNYKPEFFFIKI